MSLQLHCTRSKIFIQSGSRPVKCGRNETTNVPNWVRDTIGYKMGVADKSIIDLTPGSGNPAVADDTVASLQARIAELEAQLNQKPSDPPVDGDGREDATSVVDLSTAKSTAEATGATAEGVSEPKPEKVTKATKPPTAKGLQR